MSAQTFKQFLIAEAEEAKKETKGSRKLFSPDRFTEQIKKVLDMLAKASAGESEIYDDLVMLEAFSIIKEVLIERLMPFHEDPKYREYRDDKGNDKLMRSIEEEIKDTLHTHFAKYKPAMNQLVNLIVVPILDEIKRVGPASAVRNFDIQHFDMNAKDSFGMLMRYFVNSDQFPHAEDAQVAQEVLKSWSKDVRTTRRPQKKVTRRQRLNMIARAAEKLQDSGDEEGGDEREEVK